MQLLLPSSYSALQLLPSALYMQLNSEAHMKLNTIWLEASKLPASVKEAVRHDLLQPGMVPAQQKVEFTAPIIRVALSWHYEEAYVTHQCEI